MSWTEADLAYMAGIVDGEGTIGARRRTNSKGRVYIDFSLSVANTDKRLIDWIQDRFPAGVDLREQRQSDRHKPLYRWTTNGRKGEEYITAIRPYLVIKAEQADTYVALRATIGGGEALSAEVLSEREILVSRLRDLNRRGKVA